MDILTGKNVAIEVRKFPDLVEVSISNRAENQDHFWKITIIPSLAIYEEVSNISREGEVTSLNNADLRPKLKKDQLSIQGDILEEQLNEVHDTFNSIARLLVGPDFEHQVFQVEERKHILKIELTDDFCDLLDQATAVISNPDCRKLTLPQKINSIANIFIEIPRLFECVDIDPSFLSSVDELSKACKDCIESECQEESLAVCLKIQEMKTAFAQNCPEIQADIIDDLLNSEPRRDPQSFIELAKVISHAINIFVTERPEEGLFPMPEDKKRKLRQFAARLGDLQDKDNYFNSRTQTGLPLLRDFINKCLDDQREDLANKDIPVLTFKMIQEILNPLHLKAYELSRQPLAVPPKGFLGSLRRTASDIKALQDIDKIKDEPGVDSPLQVATLKSSLSFEIEELERCLGLCKEVSSHYEVICLHALINQLEEVCARGLEYRDFQDLLDYYISPFLEE